MRRALVGAALLILACSREAPAGAPSAPRRTSTPVKACGVELAGRVLAETGAPGYDGSSTRDCRFAADESVAELAARFAREQPSWHEQPPRGEAREWTAMPRPGLSLQITATPVSEAVRASHPAAQAEVQVHELQSGTCPPCPQHMPGCPACP
ncbi:hypothetical protein [Nannocystis sp. SCPEA4]|uniref:hypothetical protein n=1 Tax=Nannocystis sp. SCPEA4 TaxID=2996787 RepID=UPI00226F5736|nr:hypothetical protein [Nannocystis sp. SCPEA4]MCY1057723.1 hypothetical protein [Nannocystis sp. SCPEA4]